MTIRPMPVVLAAALTLAAACGGGAEGAPVSEVSTDDTGVTSSYRRLFVRTTEADVTIRAYADDAAGVGVVELSTDAAVGTGAMVGAGQGLVGAGRFGGREGAPVAWVAWVAFEGTVRASGGAVHDEMAPTEGIAVLAVPTDAGELVVEALDEAGAVVGEETVVLPPEGAAPTPPTTSTVPPPPTTSTAPPGQTPSEDDEAGVRAAYSQAFTGTNGPEVNLAAVEGGSTLGPTLDALSRDFPEAVRTVTAEVWDVRIVEADRAVLRFELDYTGGALFGPQDGRAVRVDGTWLVAHPTYCLVMSWGGATCPAR